jgi:hypothetical protein
MIHDFTILKEKSRKDFFKKINFDLLNKFPFQLTFLKVFQSFSDIFLLKESREGSLKKSLEIWGYSINFSFKNCRRKFQI